MNLTKEAKDLYTENDKIKEDTNKWKDIPSSWFGRLTVKMAILSRVTYRLNAIPVKILIYLLQKQKTHLKIHAESQTQSLQRAKTNMKKKNKVGDLMLLDFKTY